MITFLALLFILIVIAIVIFATIGTGLLGLILVFGDLIICVLIIVAIVKACSKGKDGK